MKYAFLAIGFIIGACATILHSDVKEYTVNTTLPTVVFLEAEGTDVRNNISITEAGGMKCYKPEDNRAIKRYIVDLEQQIIECQTVCAK